MVLAGLGAALMLAALVMAFHAGNSFDPVQDWPTSLLFVAGTAVGWVGIARQTTERHARLFDGVAKVIDGKATATNRLEGWYRGRHVTLIVHPASGSLGSMGTYTLCLEIPPTGTNWKLRYGRQGGFGPKRWYVSAPDESLSDRLTAAGAVSAVEASLSRLVSSADWDAPQIECRRRGRHGYLSYSVAVRDGTVDQVTAEQFTAQLELLAYLAELNLQA